MRKIILFLLLINGISFADIINEGMVIGGKGGKSLFGKDGEPGDVIIGNISVKECLKQNKINIKYDQISFSKVKQEIYLLNNDKVIKSLAFSVCENKK